MCGFMGVIGPGVDVKRGLPWLGRRGPDRHHVWSSVDTSVSLLHCRLAIVDADPRADQPFIDKNRGITVALNGEIYNYRQLRRELADYPFRSNSDTEVIVAAYAAHGVDGLRLLQGMFAFTLIDERRQRILLVRDPVGKKPLFLRRVGHNTLFGSSVLPLIACGDAGAMIDPAATRFYWTRGYVSPDRSVFKDVQPVLPGEAVELDWQGRETATRRYEPQPSLLYQGEGRKDVIYNVECLISNSVDRRLENNPNPVALLSGGIDSTVIAQATRDRLKQNGRPETLKVLTLGALIPYTQDEFYARFAARRLELALQIISPSRGGLSDSILRALSIQDEPLGMPSYYLLHQLVEAAAQYGRVLLTGDGGDEVFLGYRSPADWRNHSAAPGKPAFVKVGPGPSDWMGSWARDVTGNTLLGHMLTKIDRASAEQGVEIRCPLLDWSLICYVRSLPFELLIENETLKFLLKSQLSSWPKWFVNRPKLGFAFNLRWRWALTRFDGLREAVTNETIEMFDDLVPRELQRAARDWATRDIMMHFSEAWRLLAWSAFLGRASKNMRDARRAASASFPASGVPA